MSYKNTNLELVIDLSPQTPSMLSGDIRKLHKLFRHLLDNAIKFTHRGGIYIKVFTIPQEYGVNLTIEITDTGIGMTRADMARVSKGMYQANKKRNRSTGGIGIGLPIVYGFVHKMNGFVMINSEKGNGTCVRLSIPQKVIDPTPCLSLNDNVKDGFIFYVRPDKYQVAEIRDFYRSMAANLAIGLKMKLYAAGEKRELDRLIKELYITHIFMGQEEYEADKEYLEQLAGEGYKVVVSADPGFQVGSKSGIIMMPKPLYAFPVVRILNGETGIDVSSADDEGKVRFTGVRALVVDDEPMNLVVATETVHHLIFITITSGSSNEFERASKAALAFENVTVINSECLSSATGILAMVAARLAQQNLTVEKIVTELEEVKKQIRCSFVIKTTDVMARRQRISPVMKSILNAFWLRPMLQTGPLQ